MSHPNMRSSLWSEYCASVFSGMIMTASEVQLSNEADHVFCIRARRGETPARSAVAAVHGENRQQTPPQFQMSWTVVQKCS